LSFLAEVELAVRVAVADAVLPAAVPLDFFASLELFGFFHVVGVGVWGQ
jgi:hypothetical protein